ncbi:DUF4873 domain-containing protein [Pseudonocardia endophytica]|uniref:Uncharacterized protein DUF4873 n=1 Tax=Pseudonocardia endophytica TaxID=401976 RepID=A0A4R1HY77_PSEEN|nr:DUF4873 domain-containing protein [Pseudonocardia endophytica]TCK26471.1 uncharacterized protein DUF4873 [Pseudonocardia endophytica]
MADQDHDHDGEYEGPATIVVDGTEVVVEVRLGCHHEPFDGKLHWAGRVKAEPRLAELVGTGADVEVRTEGHSATGRLGDADLWDRYRLTGTGRPPFALDVADA